MDDRRDAFYSPGERRGIEEIALHGRNPGRNLFTTAHECAAFNTCLHETRHKTRTHKTSGTRD
jgi:hypothetical protein